MRRESIPDLHPASKIVTEFISNLPFFDALEMPELELIASRMNLVQLEAGEVLFEEWDKGDYVCFIESGTLEVLKKSGVDTYAAIGTLGRGKSIGEMAIIENFPRAATLKALTPATVVTFAKSDFEFILASRPDLGIKLLKGLARLLGHNLRKASSRLADYMMPMG